MHFSINDDSKALFVGDEDESKELINFENIALDDIDNKWPHSTCSKLNNETVTQRNAAEELKQESEEGSKKLPQVSQNTDRDETVTQRNAAEELKQESKDGSKKLPQVPQNTDRDDVKQEEDFVAKDLLCFAWQIARGMVSAETSTNISKDLDDENNKCIILKVTDL